LQRSNGSGSTSPPCYVMLRESGDAAFGLQRIGFESGGGGTSSEIGPSYAFNNVIIISPIFSFHLQGTAGVSAALSSFKSRAPSRIPPFFFVEKQVQQGGGPQLALWGYVHESGEVIAFPRFADTDDSPRQGNAYLSVDVCVMIWSSIDKVICRLRRQVFFVTGAIA
jgi:hypothetical protein